MRRRQKDIRNTMRESARGSQELKTGKGNEEMKCNISAVKSVREKAIGNWSSQGERVTETNYGKWKQDS